MTLELNQYGALDAYAWPGGYPLLYVNDAGDVFCAKCAANAVKDEEATDKPVCGDVYWQGSPEHCCCCGVEIESAYGVPERE